MAYDNKVMEALGKFMNVFYKKRMEMQGKSFKKEWGGVNSSNCKKCLTGAYQLRLEKTVRTSAMKLL
jgi:hypothetical protein